MVAVSVSRFSKEPRSIEFHIEVKINRTDLVKKNLWVWEVGVQFFKRPGHLLNDFLGWLCMRDRWYFEEKLWTFKKKLKSPFFYYHSNVCTAWNCFGFLNFCVEKYSTFQTSSLVKLYLYNIQCQLEIFTHFLHQSCNQQENNGNQKVKIIHLFA